MNKATLTTLSMLVIAGTTAAASAQLDINGGTSWTGWNSQGNSLTTGFWGAGSTTSDFDVYTSVFNFDSSIHTVSGSTFGNPGFGGTGFANGNLILAIGVGLNNGNATLAVPTIKFDTDNNNGFAAASSVGATDGVVSSSNQTIGDFNQQFNGTNSQDGTPSFYGLHQGTNVLDFTLVFGGNTGPVRSFYDAAGGGYQLFFDLTEYQANFGAGPIGSNVSFVLASGLLGDQGETQVVVSNLTVPTPGSAALLGLAGLAATRRRR